MSHIAAMPRDSTHTSLPAALDRAQASTRAARTQSVVVATLAGALGWLLFGCLGLLWTIAFTADTRSMVIGLAVWVFCFVAPSTLATVLAYRLDERAGGECERDRATAGARASMAAAGD